MNNLSEIFKTFFNFQYSIGKKYIEIRFIKTMNGIVSGIFETTEQGAESLANEVKRLELEKCSMYHTINIISDEYVNNFAAQYKINTLYPNTKKTTSDANISRIRLIMLDFDPKRASGISSTDAEKAKAKECMDSLITALTSENFPLPAYITDSGNGYNTYLMVDFPNDKEHNKLIADFIKIVHDKYSDDFVDVDQSTKNPARIAKVPGSWSTKGDNTAERPHRQCKLLEIHTD